VLAANMGGKIKATAQFLIVLMYMLLAFVETDLVSAYDAEPLAIIRFIFMILLIGTTILTVYTGASYLIKNRKVFKDKNQNNTQNKEDK
jgi:phosphatidylglycerophosphate synthase